MIEVRDLSKRFSQKTIFDHFSLQFHKNETVFVLGRSGVGKSVLLKHLVGLIKPDEGEIWIDGENISNFDEAQLTCIRKKCGMIFQFPALLDSLTVFENISFGIRAHRMTSSEREIEALVKEAMELVRLSFKLKEAYPSELSFGTQKRVSIARTLATRPAYILFDEPTTGMDPVITRFINVLIEDLKKKLGVGTVVVSHDLESAFQIGDRLVLIDEGQVVFNGNRSAFLTSEVPLAKAFLKETNVKLF